jgi:hypothetical protein
MHALLNPWSGSGFKSKFIKCTHCKRLGHTAYINELTALCVNCLNAAGKIVQSAVLERSSHGSRI